MTVKGDTAERRRFIPAWKAQYPWVFLNEQRNGMCFRYCVSAGKHNARFHHGGGLLSLQKGRSSNAAMTADHCAALEARNCRRDMEQAVSGLI